MQTVLDEAIEQYRRDRFFRELDDSYARLQLKPKAWQDELDERRLWESASADGLLDSEWARPPLNRAGVKSGTPMLSPLPAASQEESVRAWLSPIIDSIAAAHSSSSSYLSLAPSAVLPHMFASIRPRVV